jgi:hypothetical protein
VIDFRIGSQAYHYAGPATSLAHLAAQSANVEEYSHTIFLDTPNCRYGFVYELLGPSGSMGKYNPLAALALPWLLLRRARRMRLAEGS